jgi:hypothetical protein
MSLQISTVFASGLSASAAVHKIASLTFHAPETVVAELGVYVDLSKSQDGTTPPVERRQFTMTGFDPAASGNVHTQVYTWLKTLADYTEATDV